MPLFEPEKRLANEPLHITLPSDAIAKLKAYAKYLNGSTPAYVLTQLIAGLDKDKEFQKWLAANPGEALASAAPSAKNDASKVKEVSA